MKILFVVNSYFSKGNGLDESARRTVQALRAAGQDVRVLSGPNIDEPDGEQPEYRMGYLTCQLLYRYWCRVFYDKYQFLQCLTENVRERLLRHHVKAHCFTLSNGVIPDKCLRPLTPPEDYLDENRPLDLIYIGRTAIEKDQPTLYKAIRLSRYAKRIRLHIAGRGPKLAEYTRMAEQLYADGVVDYKPVVGFYNRDELRELAAHADLAVHCAYVEVEGMSITEALQQAVVPVIATARYSGTATYALDENSTFPEGDAQALAARIDYWFDHPQKRWAMGFRYAESMKK